MTLDATVGGVTSNSFSTVEKADEYFAGRLYADEWNSDAERADKEKALITFTGRLNQETYCGCKTSASQALKFPRTGITDDDDVPYDSDAIPRPVEEALFEGALELLKSDILAESKLTNLAQMEIGPVKITPRQPQQSGALPAQVRRLLRGLLASSGGTVRVVRG